jgi:hypothetical protein
MGIAPLDFVGEGIDTEAEVAMSVEAEVAMPVRLILMGVPVALQPFKISVSAMRI